MEHDIEVVYWDLDDDPDGNVQHVALHGLTPDEVDSVLYNTAKDVIWNHQHQRWSAFGTTHTGRFILVAYDVVTDDPLAVYPVTAYEVPEAGSQNP